MLLPSLALIILASLVPLGKHGSTYPIAEKDASIEMEERISNVDAEKVRAELEQKYRNYTPKDWKNLPPAPKNTSYLVDMTYTTDRDIPTVDKKGNITGILYPKGYTFNPLDYTPVDPIPLVIFNGDSKAETDWVRYWYKDKNVMLVATQGDLAELTRKIGNQVYYLKEIMAKALRLNGTVSVVSRAANMMKVEVYAVEAEAARKNMQGSASK